MFMGVLLLVGSVLLFLAAMGWGLPKLLLRTNYAVAQPEGVDVTVNYDLDLVSGALIVLPENEQ